MKFTKMFVMIALLSLAAVPAMGELTDYQKGVEAGLQAGMTIAKLLGAAPFDPSMAQQYNNQVNAFDQGLSGIFAGNQTVIDKFWLKPYGTATAAAAYATKPVHSIDGSWNNTTRVLGDPDEGQRIYDMPASSYYTWVGTTGKNTPVAYGTDANGKAIMGSDAMGSV
jgi:hypothetical protein